MVISVATMASRWSLRLPLATIRSEGRMLESESVSPAALRIEVVGSTLIFVTAAPDRRSIWITRVEALTVPTMPETSSLLPVAVTPVSIVGEALAGRVPDPEGALGEREMPVLVAVGLDFELPSHPVAKAAISAQHMIAGARSRIAAA
jgi:hypothetical protein